MFCDFRVDMEKAYNEKTEFQINQEFRRLKGQCYLDHAGTTLYSETQVKNICDDLCNNIYGNPHSLGLHSEHCTDVVEEIRNRILKHFHTSQATYSLIFTSGATAAIRLLVENFDWKSEYENEDDEKYFDSYSSVSDINNSSSVYIYTQSNHTSIVGARELAAAEGVTFHCLGYDESFSLLDELVAEKYPRHTSNSLFAYPSQCNFSGRKYPLEWIRRVQSGALDSYGTVRGENRNCKWFVLLDAATYCSTNDLDLSAFSPDFVCLSFYKIFGYPTGLGALLVRNTSAYVLRKEYFGGGTVEISLAGQNFRKFRKNLHERFEDGTISFLSIVALNHGLKTLQRLNLDMKLISQHVFNLANYAYLKMKMLKHWNGQQLVHFYADSDYDDIKKQGGIINFNLLRSNRQYVGFTEVLHIANLHKIQFRTGCFCNSGACQRHLGLTDHDLKRHFEAGHVCGDSKDLIDGIPTGSIRISFGYMTSYDDVDVFLKMIRECFLERIPPRIQPMDSKIRGGTRRITLKKIWVYPIKSCGAMEVTSWKLNEKGLEYDREWMVINETGVCLTQKQLPRMCLVIPSLDVQKREMTLIFRTGNDTITIPVDSENLTHTRYEICESKVCGDRILGYDRGDEVSEWLSRNLNVKGLRLVQQSNRDERKNKRSSDVNGKLSFSNQAQFLLLNQGSIKWLQERIEAGDDINEDTFEHRFRGNFLVDGADEFSESNWSNVTIGNTEFTITGPCNRCQMICIDQYTGETSRKPLITLSRVLNGKMRFGIYLSHVQNGTQPIIRVGDEVVVRCES